MAFSFKNSRDQTYYLHKKVVKLRGSGKMQTIYFFARDTRPGSMDELPDGYKVKEVMRTGLPVLKKG